MRLRVRFTKLGKVRFISHRDLARVWERALRRAELPIIYTEGFSPRPKLHFGLALSTGYESVCEYIDIDLTEELSEHDLSTLGPRLCAVLPAGVDVTAMAPTPAIGATSLQEAVISCSWRIELLSPAAEVARAAVDQILARPSVIVTRIRKGKEVTDDLRPYLHHLELDEGSQTPALLADLGTQPRSVRPAELLAALEPPLVDRSICRLNQWIAGDGQRAEPLSSLARAEIGVL